MKARTLTRTRERLAAFLGQCAHAALLEEVFTTPKPGLVDLHDNGAHTDMTCATFETSADAIAPYFARMAQLGLEAGTDAPEMIFPAVRALGRQAEDAMFRATDGVNTHKGALFTMGILCTAAGCCFGQYGCAETEPLLVLAQHMTARTLTDELREIGCRPPKTHGERLYRKYGVRGVRGEIIDGFPTLRAVCSVLDSASPSDANWEQVKLQALLVSMARLKDTNVVSRGDLSAAVWLRAEAETLLRRGGAFAPDGYDTLARMNHSCIQKNISPGGSADLLAAGVFLHLIRA